MSMCMSLIIWVLCAVGCYKIAEDQGRNTTIAVILGELFGVLAILGYLIIGKKRNG